MCGCWSVGQLVGISATLGGVVVSLGCNVPCSVCPGPCTFMTHSHLTAAGEELGHQHEPLGSGQESAWAAVCILVWLCSAPCRIAQSYSKQNAPLHAVDDEVLEGGGSRGQALWPWSVSSISYCLSEFRAQHSALEFIRREIRGHLTTIPSSSCTQKKKPFLQREKLLFFLLENLKPLLSEHVLRNTWESHKLAPLSDLGFLCKQDVRAPVGL